MVELKKAFVSAVARELRAGAVSDDAAKKEAWDSLSRELLGLRILDWERWDNASFHLQVAEVEIEELLTKLPQEQLALRAVIEKKSLDVNLVTGSPFTLKGDAELLRRAFTELLANAARWSPEKGSIYVALESDEEGCEVTITDEGPGFPSELEQRIRELFVAGPDGGLGVGLAFVDRVVAAHGGSMELNSDIGLSAILKLPKGELFRVGADLMFGVELLKTP